MFGLSLEEVAFSMQGKLYGENCNYEPSGASIDTRSVKKGELFFALKGEKADGHKYLKKAKDNGAIAAVVSYIPSDYVASNFTLIIVKDTVEALQQLAAVQRTLFEGIVIAVTGSTGKTTTKDMMASILREKGNVLQTKDNFNNELGMPLTILALKKEHQFIVTEMGMRGLGEIDFLCKIAQPNYGVITNIGHTHQEFLGSQEKIAQAKSEMISHISAKGGLALNIKDNNILNPWISENCPPVLWFGLTAGADLTATEVCLSDENRISFSIMFRGQKVAEINLPVPGRHNVLNALAAVAIARQVGLTWQEIKTGLEKVKLTSMRLEFTMISDKNVQVINDAYNANPDSTISALEVLSAAAKGGRAIGVLGDMYELGEYSKKGHLLVGRQAKSEDLAYLITVGKLGAIIAKGAFEAGMDSDKIKICKNNKKALDCLLEIIEPRDVILVKGSRGVKMEEIVVGLS